MAVTDSRCLQSGSGRNLRARDLKCLGLIMGDKLINNILQISQHDAFDFINRKIDTVITDTSLGEIIGSDTLAAVAAANHALALA